MIRPLIAALGLLIGAPLFAQDAEYDAEQLAEIERREAFQTQFAEIVRELNEGSFRALSNAIDQEQMLEQIFGLRLIDRRVRDDFEERFMETLPTIVESGFSAAGDDFKAHLLEVASSGNRGRARVRYDLPKFQFNYHEYDLSMDASGQLQIIDWTDFLSGGNFSEVIGQSLIAAAPGKSAVRKLIETQRPTEQQVFQITELLKAARDRQRDRFLEIHTTLNDELKSQRITVMSYARLMRSLRSRRGLRGALIEVAEYFPNDPLYSLMLLDYYFPTRRYQEAYDALVALQNRLGVEDSAMQARLSAATLVLGRAGDALAYAERAVEIEPGLELGWWSVLRAAVATSRFAEAVGALDTLTGQFEHTLDQETLSKDPMFRELLASAEFKAWSAEQP